MLKKDLYLFSFFSLLIAAAFLRVLNRDPSIPSTNSLSSPSRTNNRENKRSKIPLPVAMFNRPLRAGFAYASAVDTARFVEKRSPRRIIHHPHPPSRIGFTAKLNRTIGTFSPVGRAGAHIRHRLKTALRCSQAAMRNRCGLGVPADFVELEPLPRVGSCSTSCRS